MASQGMQYLIVEINRMNLDNGTKPEIIRNLHSDIGKFSIEQKLVNLNADRKRMWFEDLKNINDGKMINSLPISLNYIKKDEI
jgi:hypothetical protein